MKTIKLFIYIDKTYQYKGIDIYNKNQAYSFLFVLYCIILFILFIVLLFPKILPYISLFQVALIS